MPIPPYGEGAAVDSQVFSLGQGYIPQQLQGGAGMGCSMAEGIPQGMEIGSLLPCRDQGRRNIAAGAAIAVFRRQLMLVGNGISSSILPGCVFRVNIHQLCAIGQGDALRQQGTQASALIAQGRRIRYACFEGAAGYLHPAHRRLDDLGRIQAAPNNQGAAVADGWAAGIDNFTVPLQDKASAFSHNQKRVGFVDIYVISVQIQGNGAGCDGKGMVVFLQQGDDSSPFCPTGEVCGGLQIIVVCHCLANGDLGNRLPPAGAYPVFPRRVGMVSYRQGLVNGIA